MNQVVPSLNILISHSAIEKDLAAPWQKLLSEISRGKIAVWYSSDISADGGVDLGEWRNDLYQRLLESHIVLAIQTPVSNGRPWIMWECGVASGVEKVRKIVPILYSIERGKLENPLSTYQSYQGDNEEQVRELCGRLLAEAGLQVPTRRGELTPHLRRYMSTIKLYQPQQGPAAQVKQTSQVEEIAYWRDHLNDVVEEGRASELSAERGLMYGSLTKKPLILPIHDLLSLYLNKQKKYPEAIEEITYALNLSPKNTKLLHRKALILLGLKEYVKAQEPIKEIIMLDKTLKTNPEIAGLEGRLHRELWATNNDSRELDAAIEAYGRAYEADPTSYYTGLNTAELLIIRGRKEEGEETFKKVLATCQPLLAQPVVPFWVDFTVGEAAFALGDINKAASAYEDGLKRKPAPDKWEREAAFGSIDRLANVLKSSPEDVECLRSILVQK